MAYSVSYGSTLPTTVTGNTYAIGFGFTGKGTGTTAGWNSTQAAKLVTTKWVPPGIWIMNSSLIVSTPNTAASPVYAGIIATETARGFTVNMFSAGVTTFGIPVKSFAELPTIGAYSSCFQYSNGATLVIPLAMSFTSSFNTGSTGDTVYLYVGASGQGAQSAFTWNYTIVRVG
uniref:Uncharacterized protein n=1 Tax=viral metagenome TaxID=1070528 RepID=A0A6C0BW33_9ZZZZ